MKFFNLVEVIEDDLKKLGNTFSTSRRNKFNREVFFYYNRSIYFTLTLLFYISFIALSILSFFDFSTIISLTTGFIISYFFYRLITISEEKENLKNALYFLKETLSLSEKMRKINKDSIEEIKFELDNLIIYYSYKVNNNDYPFINIFNTLKKCQNLVNGSIIDVDEVFTDFNLNENAEVNMSKVKHLIPQLAGYRRQPDYSFYADGEELGQKIKEMQEEDEKYKEEEKKENERQQKSYEG